MTTHEIIEAEMHDFNIYVHDVRGFHATGSTESTIKLWCDYIEFKKELAGEIIEDITGMSRLMRDSLQRDER